MQSFSVLKQVVHMHVKPLGFKGLFSTCFHTGFLLALFFDPEDAGNMFLRNVG
jgi:hypothetical protein